MAKINMRTAWERQMLIRDKTRPTIHDYLPLIFEDFYELHGDRGVGDDGAILGGIGRLNGRPVTLEATLYGVGIAVMLLSAVLWFRCFNEIMTSDKLLCLFGRATPKISLLLSLSLRSVPLFKKRARMIRDAQKTMGLYAADGWLCRLRASMRTYSALVTQSIEGAIDMGTSMKSRGYGLKGRTSFALFRFMKRDCILCSVIACADGITIAAGACGRLDFSFYPHITAARWDALTTAAAAAFFILSFLPFVFEVKEDIKWRFCRSKI